MPKINPVLCFDIISELARSLPQALDIDAFIQKFIDCWVTYITDKQDVFQHSLKQHLEKHIGSQATHPEKESLIKNLNFIMDLLNDATSYRLEDAEKNALLIELQDPLTLCSAGLFSVTTTIVSRYTIMNTVEKLLYKVRTNLVSGVARQISSETHANNYVFKLAQEMQLNIKVPNPSDPFPPQEPISFQEVKSLIRCEFEKSYQSFGLINLLLEEMKTQLKTNYSYIGKLESEGYKSFQYNEFLAYFKSLFNEDSKSIEYLIFNDAGEITDINWNPVKCKLIDLLFTKNFLEQSFDGEWQFMDEFLQNHMGSSAVAETIFQTDDLKLFTFMKLGDEENQDAQIALLHVMFPKLNPSQQLRLSINLLSLEYAYLRQTLSDLNASYQFTHLLFDTPTLKTYLQNPNLKEACAELITEMPVPRLAEFLNIPLSYEHTTLSYLAQYHPRALYGVINQLPKLKAQEIQSILLNKNNLGLFGLSIKHYPKCFDKLLALYLTYNALTLDFFMSLNSKGQHILMDVIIYVPEKLEIFLKYFSRLESSSLQTLWLQTNTDNISCLGLIIDKGLSDTAISAHLSQLPVHLIYLILNQTCKKELNVLFYSAKFRPETFGLLLKLILLLDKSSQKFLFKQTDRQKNNLLHLASDLNDSDYEFLLQQIFSLGYEQAFIILNQSNSLQYNVFLSTIAFNNNKLAILFKNLSLSFTKKVVSQYLFSNKSAIYQHYLHTAIKHAPYAIPPLLSELTIFPINEQLSQLNQKSAAGTCALKLAQQNVPSLTALIEFFLELLTQPFLQTELSDFLYEYCFSSPNKITKWLIILDSIDSSYETTLDKLIDFFLKKACTHSDFYTQMINLCLDAIQQRAPISNKIDMIFCMLDKLADSSQLRHCQALLTYITSNDVEKSLLISPHISVWFGFWMKKSDELARQVLDCIKAMPDELFLDLFAGCHSPLIESACGQYFIEFFQLCKARFSELEFSVQLTSINTEQESNLLIAALQANTHDNIQLVLSLSDEILVTLLTQNLNDTDSVLEHIIISHYPHTKLLVDKILQLSPSTQNQLLTHHRDLISNLLERQTPAVDGLLDFMLAKDLIHEGVLSLECLQNTFQFPAPLFQKFLSKLSQEKLKDILFNSQHQYLFSNLAHLSKQKSLHFSENIGYFLMHLKMMQCEPSQLQKQINQNNFWQISGSEIENKADILILFLSFFAKTEDKIKLFTAINAKKNNLLGFCIFMRKDITPLIHALLSFTLDTEVIYQLLSWNNKDGYNPFLYACETQQLNTTHTLLRLILEHLNSEQQQILLSYKTRKYENILTLAITRMPESLARLCEVISPNPPLVDKLLEIIDIDHELKDVFKLDHHDLSYFFNLLSLLPETTMRDILFSKEKEPAEHFLDIALLSKHHQEAALNALATFPKSVIHDLISENTLHYALSEQPNRIVTQLLQILGVQFSPRQCFEKFKKTEDLFVTCCLENFSSLLTFIHQWPQTYQAQILASFEWAAIFNQNSEFCEAFFEFLSQQTASFKKLLLQNNALMEAVFSKNKLCVTKTIELVKQLDEESQAELFADFQEAKGVLFDLKTIQESSVKLVDDATPRKRSYSSISLFNAQKSLVSKNSKPNSLDL